MKRTVLVVTLGLVLAGTAAVDAAVSAGAASTVLTVNEAVHPMTSFDRGADGSFYYMTGDANWLTNMNVWKDNGGGPVNIHTSATVYSGSAVVASGDYVYFDDSAAWPDTTTTMYKYDTVGGGAAASVYSHDSLWGLTFHDGGVYSAGDAANSIFHSGVNGSGDFTVSPMSNLGDMGNNAGPTAFDALGNLYYADGYAAVGLPRILKYSASEVADAIATTTPLDPTGHLWASISTGATGATSMTFDADGDLILTATAFASPSDLLRYSIDGGGDFDGVSSLATSDSRMGAVRVLDGTIYVSDQSGIYTIPEPASMSLMALGALALRRRRKIS